MKKYLLFIIISMAFIFVPNIVNAKTIDLYLFYGAECPHCAELEAYLDKEYKNDKELNIHKYEVWHNTDNVELWNKVQDATCVEGSGVPYFVIGDQVIRGYNKGEVFENKVDKAIKNAKNNSFKDNAGIALGLKDGTIDKECNKKDVKEKKEVETKLDVPFVGQTDLKDVSILSSAVIIGLVDGFNPCAMWVLLFLITLLLNYKDRKKMWILGLSFILTSGAIYFLFMLGVLEVRELTKEVVFLRVLIAIFALVFGGYNIYRYIKTKISKEEGCDVTSPEERKRIMIRAKKAVTNDKFILALIGIIALAVTVNFIELLCSLGLPVMFTELMNYNDITGIKSIAYLLVYIFFFLLDDLIIFFIAMKTLKITAISNKYTKYSHLIGGLIMLIMGILMLIRPEWLMLNF